MSWQQLERENERLRNLLATQNGAEVVGEVRIHPWPPCSAYPDRSCRYQDLPPSLPSPVGSIVSDLSRDIAEILRGITTPAGRCSSPPCSHCRHEDCVLWLSLISLSDTLLDMSAGEWTDRKSGDERELQKSVDFRLSEVGSAPCVCVFVSMHV